jgi:hypothetical protein
VTGGARERERELAWGRGKEWGEEKKGKKEENGEKLVGVRVVNNRQPFHTPINRRISYTLNGINFRCY